MPNLVTRLAAAIVLGSSLALAPCAPSEAINSGQQYNVLVDAPRFTLPKAITGEAVSLSEYEGQVRVVTADRGRLVDRAWHGALNALRSFAGSGSGAEEAAS